MWSTTPTSTGVWYPPISRVYTCPNSLGGASFCILPDVASAQTYCASDPACTGYLTTTDPTWHSQWPQYPNATALMSVQPVSATAPAGTQWFAKK